MGEPLKYDYDEKTEVVQQRGKSSYCLIMLAVLTDWDWWLGFLFLHKPG